MHAWKVSICTTVGPFNESKAAAALLPQLHARKIFEKLIGTDMLSDACVRGQHESVKAIFEVRTVANAMTKGSRFFESEPVCFSHNK